MNATLNEYSGAVGYSGKRSCRHCPRVFRYKIEPGDVVLLRGDGDHA